MRWDGQRESDNIEDERGRRPGTGGPGAGGRGGLGRGGPRLGGRMGLGTIVVVLIGGWLLGVNPLTLLGMLDGEGLPPMQSEEPAARNPAAPASGRPESGRPDDRTAKFVSVVLASTEDVWTEVFRQAGRTYEAPKLRLYDGRTPTACGAGDASAGPFYCPGDRRVYIDLSFFRTLEQRFKAPGDFAQAYVIAHEVGHHVQNLIGIMDKVQTARARLSDKQGNAMSVRLELQADCLAGVWAHHSERARGWLEKGDIEEALQAATAIGDDTLQRQSQGVVVPDAFTHGTARQRVQWFQTGLVQGTLRACDTFAQKGS